MHPGRSRWLKSSAPGLMMGALYSDRISWQGCSAFVESERDNSVLHLSQSISDHNAYTGRLAPGHIAHLTVFSCMRFIYIVSLSL